MIMRALDGSGDWTFGNGLQNYNYSNNAIAENVQTRLYEFLNNCFFNLGAGIDWTRLMGSKNSLQETLLTIRGVILQSFGVVRVNEINPVLVPGTRKLTVTYSIDTIFTKNLKGVINV